jgi:hypothetical protein
MGETPKEPIFTARSSGRLTAIAEIAPGILLCRCACTPDWQVYVPSENFANQKGCTPECHTAYLAEIAAEAERIRQDEERAEAKRKEDERLANLKYERLEPHLDQIDRYERRLLETLAQCGQFDLARLCQILKIDRWQDAWPYLTPLISANLILEWKQRGWKHEPRPFTLDDPYMCQIETHSRFSVRECVLELLEAAQHPIRSESVAEEPTTV